MGAKIYTKIYEISSFKLVQCSRCSFSMMVKWVNDGLLQANDGKMLINDGEVIVNDGEMLVNDNTLISPSLNTISPTSTSILPSLAWSMPSFAHLTIIEKLQRLQYRKVIFESFERVSIFRNMIDEEKTLPNFFQFSSLWKFSFLSWQMFKDLS